MDNEETPRRGEGLCRRGAECADEALVAEILGMLGTGEASIGMDGGSI